MNLEMQDLPVSCRRGSEAGLGEMARHLRPAQPCGRVQRHSSSHSSEE